MTPSRRIALASVLVLAACGDGAGTVAAPPATIPPVASVQRDETLTASDLGAQVVGTMIAVPPMHELQLAVVVFRDGVYSAQDSHLTSHATGTGETIPCRVITFLPQGPLRPDAHDLLLVADGWQIRHAETRHGSSAGYSAQTLVPGQPYAQIEHQIYGSEAGGSWSTDPRNPGSVALAVFVFARIVAIAPGHPRYAEYSRNPHAAFGSSGPLGSLDEVLGPAAPAQPSF